jgi:probable DNA repair protein
LEQDAVLESLAAAARTGATVLTANQRLSRTLRALYDNARATSGERVWPALDALPISAWVRSRWMEAVACSAIEPRLLLASHQAEAVWRRIIQESPEGGQLLDLRAAASLAFEAWRLAHAYRLPWKPALYESHDDWAAFFAWAQRFRRECDRNAWMDETRIADAVADAIARGALVPPPRVLLAGFDEFTPQQQALLDALASARCEYSALPAATPAVDLIRVSAMNTDAELRAAARWARELLVAAPGSRIGVVVPALSGLRWRVERIFTEVLHPERMNAPAAHPPRAFHISAGQPLASYPVVAAALDAIELGRTLLSLNDASRLLRSPFLAGADAERSSRALLDTRLRRARTADVTVDALRRLARQSETAWFSPEFAALIDRCRETRRQWPAAQPPSGWTESFRQLLDAAGWPGDRPLDSAEFQTVERWNELLRTMASMDAAAGPWREDEAIGRLGELASDTQFQPEDENAPVQIMGALEAAGARFDYLWITGLDDRAWPSPPHPHPFLPLGLQRERQLPHSSAEREMTFARQTIGRLKSSAPQIVVSSPGRDGDCDLRPSALIADVPEAELPSIKLRDRWSIWMSQRAACEQIADFSGPPVVDFIAPGGVSILKRQAECPFRAFAEMRLAARPLDSGDLGISPADRGTAVHKALQFFWAEMQSHERLVTMSAEQLEAAVTRATRRALESDPERTSGFRKRFLDIEEDRLKRLLLEWLAIERLRSPFTVVSREAERVVETGGLMLKARIDRVDRLSDGREIVIDYKTNAPSVSAWCDARPDEPQVPLYAISHTAPLAAVVFGQLTPGEVRFKGYAAETDTLPGVKAFAKTPEGALYDSLADRIAAWRPVLEKLARDFCEGRAEIDPKRGNKTCEQCHAGALCRIHEWSEPEAQEPDDAA